MAVIYPVVELAPLYFGRGGHPSSKYQDGFPINNVGNDWGDSGMTRGGDVGNDLRGTYRE